MFRMCGPLVANVEMEAGCTGTVAEYKGCIDVGLGGVDCVWVTGRGADSIVLSRVDAHAPRLQESRGMPCTRAFGV